MFPATSVADPLPTDQTSGLNRQLRRFLATTLRQTRPLLAAQAVQCAADRSRTSCAHFARACLRLVHGLAGHASLRQAYAAFPLTGGLLDLSGLAVDPGTEELALRFSQVAASSSTRPAAFLAGCVGELARQVRAGGGRLGRELPADLLLRDSTFVRLPLALASWLPGDGGHDVPGVRALFAHAPAEDLPDLLLLTDTRQNDCQALDEGLLDDPERLAAVRGQPLVVDLGFYSHARFARLRAADVHFVTRLHAQAADVVEEERAVQASLPNLAAGRITVRADHQITLGSPTHRAGAVLPGLRLVEAGGTPQPRAARAGAAPITDRRITDRRDLDPTTVVQLYLWRWEIELFFRWRKRIIGLPRGLGYRPNAVALTVWLAIAVHLLTILATRTLGLVRRSPTLLTRLRAALLALTAAAAAPPVSQLALPIGDPAPAPT